MSNNAATIILIGHLSFLEAFIANRNDEGNPVKKKQIIMSLICNALCAPTIVFVDRQYPHRRFPQSSGMLVGGFGRAASTKGK